MVVCLISITRDGNNVKKYFISRSGKSVLRGKKLRSDIGTNQAIILVGGQGTRLRPLTYFLPKPLIPVANYPLLEHTIAYLGDHNVKDVVLAIGYMPETVRKILGDERRSGSKLTYSIEKDPLGTAGAIKNAESHLHKQFFVFNGDIFTDLNLTEMLKFHREKKSLATIALIYVENPCAFGVVETDTDGRIKAFKEKPSPENITSHWINAGVYILDAEVLAHIPSNQHYMFENGLFPLLIKLGVPMYGYQYDGYWMDVGSPEKYLKINFDLLLAKTKSTLDYPCNVNNVNSSVMINSPVVIAKDSMIEDGVQLKGPVVIGHGCRVGKNSVIENSVIWDNVNISSDANLNYCIVPTGTQVKPGVHYSSVITNNEIKQLSL